MSRLNPQESEVTMFQKILVGYDGSKGGRAALERAAALAREGKAQLTALWVRQPLPKHADLPGEPEGEAEAAQEYFEERKREVAELAKRVGIAIGCESRAGHAAKAIVTLAKDGGYDLVVVGHSDHSELWGRLLGDTADRICDHAHCSVLIVKQ
jgi:nucleotide-binding universal stress UspA family protein